MRRRGGVDRDGNDDEQDGSESECEHEQDSFERRGVIVILAGSQLQIIKRMHDKQESLDLEFFGICLLGHIPNGVHAESLFFHLIYFAITEKSLAQQLELVVSTNDEIVVQSLLSASL